MDYCERYPLYTHLPKAAKPHTTNTSSKMDERLDPRIPARYFVPTQLRSGGGDIWLASCPIERGGILGIPYTWPRGSSWLFFLGAGMSQRLVQHCKLSRHFSSAGIASTAAEGASERLSVG